MNHGCPAPLKVVRLITRLNIGGPVRYLVSLDRGLQANRNHTVLVHGSVGKGEAPLEDLACESGISTIKIAPLGPAINPAADLKAFFAILKVIFREAPDVVHTHTAKAGALGRTAAMVFNLSRPRGRRCVVFHTYEGHVLSGYFSRLGSLAVRGIERSLALITDRVITVSSGQRAEIVEKFGIATPEKTRVVSYGLDLDTLLGQPRNAPNMRGQLGIIADDIVVGYVGRLVPIKNVAMLIRAFAAALGRHRSMSLVIAGDGPMRPDLERLATELSVADRVHFLGWTHNLPALYATFDLCALTSLNEGTPVALIEAMAAQVAVVATSVGGVPDVVENGRTGLLVPSDDTQAFADALVRLATNPDERLRLAGRTRSAVADRFSHQQLVRTVEALYREAVYQKRGIAAEAVAQV